MYHRAFTKEFFEKHQSKLLWLLNGTFRDLFRKIMCIDEVRNIYEFQPNNYKIITGFTEDKAKVEATFFTHDKFSKRLYHAFKPLWWTMHAWDWLVADRMAPSLSFGFDTLTAYPDAGTGNDTIDGTAYKFDSSNWDTTHDAASGVGVTETETNEIFGGTGIQTSGNFFIWRGILTFDVSSVSGTVESAKMSLYETYQLYANNDAQAYIGVVSASPASDNALVVGDYDSLGATLWSDKVDLDAISNNAYNDWTFNTTGITAVQSAVDGGGILATGMREGHDIEDIAYSGSNDTFNRHSCSAADNTGTSQDPKLVVNYALPVTFIPKIAIL